MLFAVWDSQDFISKHPDPEYGFRGFILVDPFFRKGKSTGSTYISTLSPSYLKADGCRNYPVFGIVYNFVQSEDEVKPSLLRYRGKETKCRWSAWFKAYLACRAFVQCRRSETSADILRFAIQI